MPLPTRVIDVGEMNLRPFLYLSRGEVGVWVALSYYWGGETDFKLTQATDEAMCGGISLETFPKTLRDSVYITRALGLRYLWIDALCIFQDSKTDWEIEAPKMGEYYTNAILTVVAGTSSSVNEGIFHQREGRKNSWNLPWRNDIVNGKPIESVVVLQSYHRTEDLDDLPAPHNCFWAQRGWTLQEDLLSWRTLSYTSNEIIWQCRTCKSWETGTTTKQGPRETFVRFKQILAEPSPGHATTRSPAQQARIYEAWYNAVSLYSVRTLTYLEDRLPAISGIAQKIAIETEDRYFAGLWEKDMLYGLLWSPNPHEGLSKKPRTDLVQSSHYIGPSWSWVSLNASIHVNSMRTARRETIQYIAQIKEVALDYATPSKFGAVSGGTIAIEGPCYISDPSAKDMVEGTNIASPHFQLFLNKTMKASLEFKARHVAHDGQQLVGLQILKHSKDYNIGCGVVFELLLLESVQNDQVSHHISKGKTFYRRIGQLSVHPTRWAHDIVKPISEEENAAWLEISSQTWPIKKFTIL